MQNERPHTIWAPKLGLDKQVILNNLFLGK